MPSLLSNIRIILVEPAGPLNVGSVARVMKNTGLQHLVLVNPHCDLLGQEARQMAVHAADILEAARVVTTLPEGLTGCRRAIATTGRPRTLAIPLEQPREVLPWLLGEVPESNTCALIFGPEDRGLNNDELNQAHRFITIPTHPSYPSLNLAQAVGICSYELYLLGTNANTSSENPRESGQPTLSASSPGVVPADSPPPAPLDQLEGFYQHLESLLLDIGYLYPHTADSRMKKFRRLLNRALPTGEEVALLRGTLSQVQWAMGKKTDRPSAPLSPPKNIDQSVNEG